MAALTRIDDLSLRGVRQDDQAISEHWQRLFYLGTILSEAELSSIT